MSHIFISYSRDDQAIVERLRNDLQNAGVEIWIDRIGLQPGTPDWDEGLRVAISQASATLLVASPNSRRSLYVRDEVALARAANKPLYPVWAAGTDWLDSIPMGLGSTQYIDVRGDAYPTGLARLIGALTGKDTVTDLFAQTAPLPTIEPPAEPRNPYKGLQPFRATDRHDFFGRDMLVENLHTDSDEE